MMWLIVITLIVFSILLKVGISLKRKHTVNELLYSLEKNYPQELNGAVGWEDTISSELAKAQISLDKGEITDEEYLFQSDFLLEKYQEIERKYNVTDLETFNEFPHQFGSTYYDYRQ